MNCHNCHKKIPPEEAVIVVGPDQTRSFCQYKCAGVWAITNKVLLKHVAYFASTPSDQKRISK